MIRIKNIRAGVVFLPGLQLRLPPGGLGAVEKPTAELERAIAAGLVVRLESEAEKAAPAISKAPSEVVPEADANAEVGAGRPSEPSSSLEDLSKLPQAEAIQRLSVEQNPAVLRTVLATDKRPRVQDFVRRRLAEVEAVAPR
jgi:hypothetical protein